MALLFDDICTNCTVLPINVPCKDYIRLGEYLSFSFTKRQIDANPKFKSLKSRILLLLIAGKNQYLQSILETKPFLK